MGFFWHGLPDYIAPWAIDVLGPDAAFIETGTLYGQTARFASETFASVDTIELDRDLHARASATLAGCGVSCHQGDSRDVLPAIVGEVSAGLLVWLDAHYSGGVTAGGDDPCPIFGELDVLLGCREPASTILAVDDARLFVGEKGYPQLDEVCARLSADGWSWLVVDDVLVATSAFNLQQLRATRPQWRQVNSMALYGAWSQIRGLQYVQRKQIGVARRLHRLLGRP